MVLNNIGGASTTPLTAGTIDLIMVIKQYREFKQHEAAFNKAHRIQQIDVDREVEKYFNRLDADVLYKYGLTRNRLSLNKVLNFEITNDMMYALMNAPDELPQRFEF